MKTSSLRILAALSLICSLASSGAATGSATPAPATSNALATAAGPCIPQSTFVIPTTHVEGRNPFYPLSTRRQKQATPRVRINAIDGLALVLNGITSPPRRTAMINGRTFEKGEAAEVKLPDGVKVQIRCVEIEDDSVLVESDEQRRVLRFRRAL